MQVLRISKGKLDAVVKKILLTVISYVSGVLTLNLYVSYRRYTRLS